MLVRGEGRQRDQYENHVLVEHDEEEVEELELPGVHLGTKNGPSVVLEAGVAAFAREIEGESRSPHQHDDAHQIQSGVREIRESREHPRVDHRHHGPQSIHPREICGDK